MTDNDPRINKLRAALDQAVNLTPHDVVLVGADGKTVRTFPASGEVLRVNFSEGKKYTVEMSGGGTAVTLETSPREALSTNMDQLTDAVNAAPGWIVSTMVADAIHKSVVLFMLDTGPELFCPNTGPDSVVRDAAGQISGVKGLLWYSTEE